MDVKALFQIIIGLVLLPVLAVFVYTAVANTSVAKVPGMTILLPLIVLGVGFGLVYGGIKTGLGK